MSPGLPRTGFNSSSLVRLLAARAGNAMMGNLDSTQTLAERLSAWLEWTDAISISTALNGGLASVPTTSRPAAPKAHRSLADEIIRVRAELSRSIGADPLLTPGKSAMKPAASVSTAMAEGLVEFLPYRRSYLGHQRSMTARIGPLRLQLWAALSAAVPALGQLAALDAAFAQAIEARERHLLSKLPQILEREFERLRQANAGTAAGPSLSKGSAPLSRPVAWVAEYGRYQRDVLLAELDMRLQPVDGMMEALSNGSTRQA